MTFSYKIVLGWLLDVYLFYVYVFIFKKGSLYFIVLIFHFMYLKRRIFQGRGVYVYANNYLHLSFVCQLPVSNDKFSMAINVI